ncbi:MAG: phosphoribosylaminoimidazolesuccinocarboxamide synthase [Actinobacteria bacterium RBG_16_67_15]|nr:MAG: phosphoribosylaminoimidazolesuccinocarboxamide synthase [Actinobacteria bacterium RBG_16_67_15]
MQRAAYEGKAKRVISQPDGVAHIYYKDDATAFNGARHEQFEGKGTLNSQITERLFEYLTAHGIPTHHLGRIDERTLAARWVDIIPIEAVVRFKVAGSLAKRTGLDYLTACDPPIVEMYYKRDDLGDPLINDDHIRLLGIATPDERDWIRAMSRRAAEALRDLFLRVGIDLVDLKFEFGRTGEGDLVLADEVSPDTCRFRDVASGEILDKDLFRFDQGDLLAGYRKLLAHLDRALAVKPGAGVQG